MGKKHQNYVHLLRAPSQENNINNKVYPFVNPSPLLCNEEQHPIQCSRGLQIHGTGNYTLRKGTGKVQSFVSHHSKMLLTVYPL